MHLTVRAVLLLMLISTAIAQKSEYWWLFPKFDENGSNTRNSTSALEDNLRNGTEELADVNFSVDAILNLDSNIDIDAENDENKNDNEGSGYSALPKNYSNWGNETETAGNSERIPDEDNDEEFVLTVDKDLKRNQTDANTIASNASQLANETEIEREDLLGPSMLEEGNLDHQLTELTKEEFDQAVFIEGDAEQLTKIEAQKNDDEIDSSGENELEDEELPEPSQTLQERDEAVHEYGDAHPSSKALLEKLNLENDEAEDSDLLAEERDQSIHDQGDAHPSSRLEMEENESNIDETEDSENFEEESLTNGEVVEIDTETVDGSSNQENDHDIHREDNSSSEESNEKNVDKTREEIIDDFDFERIVEDDLIEDENRAIANQQLEPNKKKVSEPNSIEDEITQDDDDPLPANNLDDETIEDDPLPINNEELSPSNIDDDITLHWVNEETLNTNSTEMDSKNSEIMPTVVPLAPMVPIFKTPTCNFEQRPFNLTLQPVNSVNGLHGTDTTLLCTLIPHNDSEPMPYFRLTWLFEKDDCQRNATNSNACTAVLASMSYESQFPNITYKLSYNLTQLNHTTHTGLYICDAQIYGCQSGNRNATQTSKALYMRVYIKPNYAFHIGIISSACVLLLAILAGLVSYARRVQTKSKNRYQELLSSTDIQYYPSKVLELPNSVYNATTTGFIRMSASSFSSKSSFTSNDEEA